MHTGAFCDIDWDADGKHLGFIGFPYSVDRSPYYQIKMPICRIRNGDGPSLVLMAGVHGDEYEGELTLTKTIRLLEQRDVRGAVTILPATNTPAVMAAARCSPFDSGNLNRAFPGDPAGPPTWRLAHYVEHEIFPRHDTVLDIHSGGTSMDHVVCALVETTHDKARDEQAIALLRAMHLPYAFVTDNGRDSPTSMAAALRAGCIGLSGEFGGGATVTPATMAMTAGAVDNLLLALGITTRRILTDAEMPIETQLLELGGQSFFVYAEQGGWFEPAVEAGDAVKAGDTAGWLYDIETPLAAPQALFFREDGVVLSRRLHTHCQTGDCLMNLGKVLG
ncbi:MAG: deacylase [Hyphomicrobiales bacterium]|nr:deacylase [Hyphomicrobiales bacterium]